MKQEKRLSYKAGIRRSPSDYLAQDGELAECTNLVTDNEELKVTVPPKAFITGVSPDVEGEEPTAPPKILYIHRYNDQARYICLYVYEDDYHQTKKVYAYYTLPEGITLLTRAYGDVLGRNGRTDTFFYEEGAKITSIGKTLIVVDSTGMHYFLWKADGYKTLGNRIPEPDVRFFLKPLFTQDMYNDMESEQKTSDEVIGTQNNDWVIIDQAKYNDLALGLYAENKRKIRENGGFVNPFLCRYAVELYDGTFTMVSNPIMLFPSLKNNSWCTYSLVDNYFRLHTSTLGACLAMSCSFDYTEWSDIVRNVVVFVSDEVDLYDTAIDQTLEPIAVHRELADSIRAPYSGSKSDYYVKENTNLNYYRPMAEKYISQVVDELTGASVFYKLAELGIVQDIQAAYVKIKPHVIVNLTTQTQLPEDDYYSRNVLVPQFIYAYNSRLNIASVSRDFFDGFHHFLPYDNDDEATYTFYVTIRTDTEDIVVVHGATTAEKQGIFFYYPDLRASHVVIKKGDDYILDADLKEHSGLNGAYYLRGLPTGSEPETPLEETPDSRYTTPTENPIELLPNYIIQSEVNNPFVFKAEGYHKVGTGKILGMSTTTQAMSQGQFGQYPLLVFSESGIWAMAVGNTGLFVSVHPMSREVCINPANITQTDGAVFFISKKGLMVIGGSEVRCVSAHMNGVTFDSAVLPRLDAEGIEEDAVALWAPMIEACQGAESFLEYIRDERCMMAYDYTDSRLLIINPSYGYAFAFGMGDGSLTKVILPETVTNVVNAYPDYLLQGSATVYTLYGKDREEEDETAHRAFLVTRPLKMANPEVVTSLHELKNVGAWGADSAVKTDVWVSDNLRDWYLLSSRMGAAARYFRIGLYIYMKATDRLSGTLLTVIPRREK